MPDINIVRKYVKDTIFEKLLTIEYDKENTTKKVQEWIQVVEDFFNKNYEKMYQQYLEYGEWLIIKMEDGSLELV